MLSKTLLHRSLLLLYLLWEFRSSLAFFLSVSMVPEKKTALLTISDPNSVPVSTPRHTWPDHRVVKHSFWEKALKGPVEEGHEFEYLSFRSICSGTTLDQSVYRTLFRDYDDGEGSVLLPGPSWGWESRGRRSPSVVSNLSWKHKGVRPLISGLGERWPSIKWRKLFN